MENQDVKNKKVVLSQISFRVSKEKLKFIKCLMIDKDTNVNKYFNEFVDRLMALSNKEKSKNAVNENKKQDEIINPLADGNKSNSFERSDNIQ
ncbi:hypothetical protein [Castellaniella sp. MT123]|uniref:hypothetical protein n=1 Tax=Castellaniella sp. MT123 TaxID=3140381 RepID=UPI0031F34219